MENNLKVKTLITRINNKCDKENISLSEVLSSLNITPINYLSILGIDTSIINETILENIITLFSNSDTKVVISPTNGDEIEIYSNQCFTTIHFNKERVTLEKNTSFFKEEDRYEDSFTCICKKDEEISFKISTIVEKDALKSRIITLKYPLKHMHIEVCYKSNSLNKAYEFTINNDILRSDLNYIIRLLNNFKYIEAYSILKRYPSDFKILSI